MPRMFPHVVRLTMLMAVGEPAWGQSAVIGRATVRPFFEAAATGRVDIVMMGDSNQVGGGEGWDRGITVALSDRFPMYATGLHSCGENDGKLFAIGHGSSTWGTSNVVAHAGAPNWADRYMPAQPGIFPNNYIYVPAGDSLPWEKDTGLAFGWPSPVDVTGPIRFHLTYATFVSRDAGSFRPVVRLFTPPVQIAASDPIQTATGTFGIETMFLDVPAGDRSALWFRLTPAQTPETQDLNGPFVGYYQRAENISRMTGASAHTLFGNPGKTARDMALVLIEAPDEQLSLYFSLVRSLQGAEKHVMLRVNSGANDIFQTKPSVGPKKIVVGNSGEAFADNMQALVDRLHSIWALNGWPAEELYFDIAVTHPIAAPDHPLLIEYRDWTESVVLANPRVALTRFDAITSYDELQSLNWYALPTDPLHLSLAGYEGLSRREVQAMVACPGDFNTDGSLNIDDFVAFQSYYAAGSAGADMNDDGALTIDDFIEHQTLYSLGC